MHHDRSSQHSTTRKPSRANNTSRRTTKAAALSTMLAMLAYATGCNSELGQQFRRAAGPQLEAGITQVLNGIVDGAFEVYQPDNDATDTSTG